MIDKDNGLFYLVCDVCGEAVDQRFNRFDDAVDYKVDNGWKSQKRNGEWEDVCPDCQKEERER